MPIPIHCEHCGVEYQITDAAAGKRIRCKDCGEPISVPGGPSASRRPPARPRSRPAPRRVAPVSRPGRPNPDPYDDVVPQRRARKRKPGGGSRLLFVGVGIGALTIVAAAVFLLLSQLGGGDLKDGLTKRGPAPQRYDLIPPVPGVTAVTYKSDGRQLKAWMTKPPTAGPHPAVVFFHGGFAFGLGDLEACRPFQDAGFVVLAPTYRGENGNPGDFEMMAGEVDDAVAAINWLATQPDIDANNIYTFGHSVGGGISALVSLRRDAPIVHGGSTGGLYDQITFAGWSDDAPFDYRNPKENNRRVLKDRESQMVHDHYGYYGSDDFAIASVAAQMDTSGRLSTFAVPGNHSTSVTESMRRYLKVIQQTRRPSAGGRRDSAVVASTPNPPGSAPSGPPSGSSIRPGLPIGPSGRNRSSGLPNFPSGPTGRLGPGFGGGSGRDAGAGSPLGDVPRGADSDEDLATLREIIQSGDRFKTSRAISVLSRSSRKEEAAAIVALAAATDRNRVLTTLPRFGPSGETQLLKLFDAGLDNLGESLVVSGLTRCGTEKCLPLLDRLAQQGGSNAIPAKAAATMIRSKLGRR